MSPMVRFLLRKMSGNRWLTLQLWIGLTVAVALTACIPIYKDAAVNRIIERSLQQRDSGTPPGAMRIGYQAAAREYTDPQALLDADAYALERLPERIGLPLLASVRTWSLRSQTLAPADEARRAADGRRRQMAAVSRSGLTEEIRIVSGTGWDGSGGAAEGADGGGSAHSGGGAGGVAVLEALVWEDALARNDMRVGESYLYPVQTRSGQVVYTVRIVGSFQMKDPASPYWEVGADALSSSLFVSDETFLALLADDRANVAEAGWTYRFDLSGLKSGQLPGLLSALSRVDPDVYAMLSGAKTSYGFAGLLAEFRAAGARLEASLFVLAAPMLAVALYFIATGAARSLARQRTDIAVLRSRGGTASQLTRLFLYESLLLGAPAYAVGLAAAPFLARVIGSTDGFLRFVSGKEMELSVPPAAFLYGALAVAAAVCAATLPARKYARSSIVQTRRDQAREDRPPLWQRLYLDAAALAAAGYGWYALRTRSGWLAAIGGTGAGGASGAGGAAGAAAAFGDAQPYLFFIPAFAIFAGALCFLRLFPWLLRLAHAAGGRWLPLPLHLTVLTLSRSASAAYPLMLLLALTLGLGVYHASAARTIDANAARAIRYDGGADLVLRTAWEGYADEYDENGEYRDESEARTTVYTEPPFEPIRRLSGVQAAAKVLKEEVSLSASGKPAGKGTLMGIQNVDFARAASFEPGLYPAHPYQYLRLLGAYEQAALVSRPFAERYGLVPGDAIELTVRGERIGFIIVAVVPYWPSLDPEQAPFVVANLDYIYDRTPLVPYEIWIDMADGAKVAPLLAELREAGQRVAGVRDVRSELVLMRLDPAKEGAFGLLTLGFLISVLLSFLGYLLHWLLALSQRTVQFGVLRASGLSRRQLTVMLLAEQLLTTGLAIGVGLLLGGLAGLVFLPLLEDGPRQGPPFAVELDGGDVLRLAAVTAVMVGIGAAALAAHVRRLRVHQAVKLGEER